MEEMTAAEWTRRWEKLREIRSPITDKVQEDMAEVGLEVAGTISSNVLPRMDYVLELAEYAIWIQESKEEMARRDSEPKEVIKEVRVDIDVYSDSKSVCVSASHCGFPAGTAEASQIFWQGDDTWFVNRVLVRPPHRGKGLGKDLVTKLLEETTKRGCKKLVLTPGGYDLPYEQQEAFYLKCGFRLIERGLMEYP